MKLAIIGTGKIVHEALFAIEELSEIEKVAIYAREHSKEKADGQPILRRKQISNNNQIRLK